MKVIRIAQTLTEYQVSWAVCVPAMFSITLIHSRLYSQTGSFFNAPSLPSKWNKLFCLFFFSRKHVTSLQSFSSNQDKNYEKSICEWQWQLLAKGLCSFQCVASNGCQAARTRQMPHSVARSPECAGDGGGSSQTGHACCSCHLQ